MCCNRSKTLNPMWDETFLFAVQAMENEEVVLEVIQPANPDAKGQHAMQ